MYPTTRFDISVRSIWGRGKTKLKLRRAAGVSNPNSSPSSTAVMCRLSADPWLEWIVVSRLTELTDLVSPHSHSSQRVSWYFHVIDSTVT